MTNKKAKKSSSTDAIKAIQVAFELRAGVPDFIREVAAKNGLTPSDQIRSIIGLSYRKAKRPRLTLSLARQDYEILGKRYKLDADERELIRKKIQDEIVTFHKNNRVESAK